MKLEPLQHAAALSRADFRAQHVQRSRPVVLRGAASHWPAMKSWTFPSLGALFGEQRVRVRGSDSALDVFFGGQHEREMTFSQYLDEILDTKRDGPRPYLGNLWLNHPQMEAAVLKLFEDFQFADYFSEEPDYQVRVWVAGQGQRSTIHNDSYENMNAQVVGNKRFLLFAPESHDLLYPQKINDQLWASPVNPQAPQLEAYPRFSELSGFECLLQPGDVLYIPKYWWHQALSESACINLNCWSYSQNAIDATWENERLRRTPLPCKSQHAGQGLAG